ncbi:MAG: hypothetical protein IKT52_11995 [Oscillospiraceae bacterium]|nr:hypothetical protein [Oscillospiraceae bacterium]
MGPLQNLFSLRADMQRKGWTIDSFRFPFREVNYIVLAILYSPEEAKEKYALLKLDFLHPENFKHHLLVPANSNGLMADAMELRIFFRIPPDYEHLGDALRTLTRELGYCTPTKVNTEKSKTEKKAIVYKISDENSDDAEKLYCFAVKRNPVLWDKEANTPRQLKRSANNDRKTQFLRPTLYEKLGKDDTLSFCYSNNPKMDYSDEVIIDNWLKNKEKELNLQPV